MRKVTYSIRCVKLVTRANVIVTRAGNIISAQVAHYTFLTTIMTNTIFFILILNLFRTLWDIRIKIDYYSFVFVILSYFRMLKKLRNLELLIEIVKIKNTIWNFLECNSSKLEKSWFKGISPNYILYLHIKRLWIIYFVIKIH